MKDLRQDSTYGEFSANIDIAHGHYNSGNFFSVLSSNYSTFLNKVQESSIPVIESQYAAKKVYYTNVEEKILPELIINLFIENNKSIDEQIQREKNDMETTNVKLDNVLKSLIRAKENPPKSKLRELIMRNNEVEYQEETSELEDLIKKRNDLQKHFTRYNNPNMDFEEKLIDGDILYYCFCCIFCLDNGNV